MHANAREGVSSKPFPHSSMATTENLDKLPLVSAVISTRNRGPRIRGTIASILKNGDPSFEIYVVDQSNDDRTNQAVKSFGFEPRICYIRSETTGLAAGHNLGINTARSHIIAITDDDCEASPNWIHEIREAFEHNPRIGLIFGNTLAAPHKTNEGFIPAYVRKSPYIARSIAEKHRVEGIGACMAIRKPVWEALGGFDECLGPGALLKSGEELDFAIRALLAGFYVYETPTAVVTHYGFRTWDEAPALIHGYLFGIGAVVAKHLKCGNWGILQLLWHLILRWAFRGPVVDLGHRPARWLRLRAFSQGFWTGLRFSIERGTNRYKAPVSQPLPAHEG